MPAKRKAPPVNERRLLLSAAKPKPWGTVQVVVVVLLLLLLVVVLRIFMIDNKVVTNLVNFGGTVTTVLPKISQK